MLILVSDIKTQKTGEIIPILKGISLSVYWI